MRVDESLINGLEAAKKGLPLNTQMHKGDRVQKPLYKERWNDDVARVWQGLVNLFQRRYPDNWREKLAEFVR